MERYDYRTNDLLGAARYAAIYFDGYDVPDEPSPSELAEDEFEQEPVVVADSKLLLAVFDEVYGAETVAATDLPF